MNFSLPSASTISLDVDSIFNVLLGFSSFLVLAVWGLIIFFCIKYRQGSAAQRSSSPARRFWPEVLLSAFIFIFGLGIFIWSAKVYHKMYSPPASALEIEVVAKQWMWIFHDPHGADQLDVLKVPLGRPVRLLMISEDVIHSFFVPAFRLKQDVLPGRYTSIWFTARQLGSFDVLCSQYCGLSHSQMHARIEVVRPEEYAATAAAPPSVTKGAEIYAKSGCAACHEGSSPVGPSLNGLYGQMVELSDGTRVLADGTYLRRSLLQPNAQIVKNYPPVMPSFQGQLSEEQLLEIIDYIKSKR